MNQTGILIVNFYQSGFFLFIKFFLGIYAAVLIADVVLILILKGLGADIRQAIKGMKMPAVPKSKMRKRWTKIRRRLESDNAFQYKAAVLEADSMIDKVLSDMGYAGKNMSERLEKIKPAQIHNYEDLKNAHQIRNRIIHEADFSIDKKQTEEIVEIYESLLENLELL